MGCQPDASAAARSTGRRTRSAEVQPSAFRFARATPARCQAPFDGADDACLAGERRKASSERLVDAARPESWNRAFKKDVPVALISPSP
jgi:hypothetical protein